eukprot:XP_010661212.1 PREDICTED: glutathione transferase GST 23-like [Vitis vinifera]
MTLPIMKKKRKKKEDIKAGVQRLCIEDVVVVIVLTDNRLDNGNLVNPYESWVHTMRSHRHKRYKPTVLVHNGKTGDELLVILKNIDEGRKQAPLLPKDPYQKVRACFWAKLGDKKEDTIRFVDLALGWLDNLISILKDIAGLKIVHEERLPLLSAWIQDFADAQIIKDNWPPQAQMLANCHALLDASCTAAASK